MLRVVIFSTLFVLKIIIGRYPTGHQPHIDHLISDIPTLHLMVKHSPLLTSHVFIGPLQNLSMMLVGRLLCGLAAAGYIPAILIFVAEIAQPHHRGWLTAVAVPSMGLGKLPAIAAVS